MNNLEMKLISFTKQDEKISFSKSEIKYFIIEVFQTCLAQCKTIIVFSFKYFSISKVFFLLKSIFKKIIFILFFININISLH